MKTIQKLQKRRGPMSKSYPAFSLPELLVVLVIIGILVLIALPNLMPLISKAKSTEAQQQLVFLHTLQKSNFYTHSRYSTSLDDLGFEQVKLTTDGGNSMIIISPRLVFLYSPFKPRRDTFLASIIS